jgi:hypothetical protein
VCTVGARAGVSLTDAGGTLLADTPTPNGPSLDIAPGGHATGFTQWTNWCGTKPPANPLTIRVHPQGGTEPLLSFTSDPPPCNAPGNPSIATPIDLSLVP